MIKITAYKTLEGYLHDTQEGARKHTQQRIDDYLDLLTNRMLKAKTKDCCKKFFMSNVKEISELIDIINDLNLEMPEATEYSQ